MKEVNKSRRAVAELYYSFVLNSATKKNKYSAVSLTQTKSKTNYAIYLHTSKTKNTKNTLQHFAKY